MPPEPTVTLRSRPRSRRSRSSTASAMMLRLVFARQTTRPRRGAAAAGAELTSEPSGEDLAHVLALGDALRQLALDGRAQRGGIPGGRLLVLDPRGGVPALHRPHAAAADAEHLAIAARRVVARQPRHERRDV